VDRLSVAKPAKVMTPPKRPTAPNQLAKSIIDIAQGWASSSPLVGGTEAAVRSIAIAMRLLSVITAMFASVSGQALAQNGLNAMQHKPTHDWVIVNEFGSSKCFVDRNSIEKRGEIARALVMYSLVPPGIDKRNDKKVAAMLNIEEYNLRTGTFRLQQIVFQYTDGTESEPLSADPDWKPATGGNQSTLKFIQGLK
jgi:hypothetical protein